MRDFFYQVVVFIAGSLIGISVPILHQKWQKVIAGVGAVLLLLLSTTWIGYEIGIQQGRVAAGTEISDNPELLQEAANLFFQQAEQYRKEGQFEGAIESFDKAIKLGYDPVAEVYFQRGLAFISLKRYEEAIEDFELSLEADYEVDESYLNKGVSHYELQDYASAIAEYTRVINNNGDSAIIANAYERRGDANCQNEEYEQALLDYADAIERGRLSAYRQQAWCYVRQDEVELAIQSHTDGINKLKDQNEDVFFSYYDRALLYKRIGRNEEAVLDLEYFLGLPGVSDKWRSEAERHLAELKN